MDPLVFEFDLGEFDLGLLPVAKELLQQDESLLRKAVKDYLTAAFKRLGGRVSVTSYDDRVHLEWTPVSASQDWDGAMELAVTLLEEGAYGVAEPVLRELERSQPDAVDVLLNYGMMLSDQDRLDEAVDRLKKVTRLDPGSAKGWIALGVALARQGKNREAAVVLEKAVEIDSDNGYALRNLGGVLAKDNPTEALPYLRKAVESMPDDQQALYGYGLCLAQNNELDEADQVFSRAIQVDGFSSIAEACRTERTRIAHINMRQGSGTDVQMDVVMYCLSAMQLFQKIGDSGMQKTTMEIALLGRNGLDINDPARKYSLKSLPGEFSGRQLLAYMYVGLRRMAPGMDPGVDFSKEYKAAESLLAQKDGTEAGDGQ